MKKFLVFTICAFIFLTSCIDKNSKISSSGYTIIGTILNQNNGTVYLSKFLDHNILNIDSTLIKNDTFYFKGNVTYPEKHLISFNNSSNKLLLILENSDITINIDYDDFNNSKVKGSYLNNELFYIKNQSEDIFKNIEYLYPSIQKARLENDVTKLAALNKEIKEIEEDNLKLILNYCENNPSSYLSPILLNDLLNNYQTIDTTRAITIYNAFPSDIKNCTDARLIAKKLF